MSEKLRSGLGRAWGLPLGDVRGIEQIQPDQRSSLQQARLDAVRWGQTGGWIFAIAAGAFPLLIGGLAGISSNEWLAGIAAFALSMIALYVGALLVFAWQAPRKALTAGREERTILLESNQRLQEQAPSLSLDPVVLPRHSSKYLLSDSPQDFIRGRVLLVPVTVSRGSQNAEAVQARLNFLPDDPEGSFSPRNAFFAEWATDDGELPTTVDIPSNGLPMHFCVAFVADAGHPAVFSWTRESKAYGLDPRAFGVAAHPVDIHVEVSGSGHGAAAPFVEDTLRLTMHNGMLSAVWASADSENLQPGVPRPHRPMPFPLPPGV